MSSEIRALTPDDYLTHRRLMSQAFGKGAVTPPPAPDAPPPKMENRWGIFEDRREIASLTIEPYIAHWGADKILPLGGIAGVATSPEARGQGHVDALLRHSLQTMHDAGQVISALYPFAWSFYRRYGWDWVGEKRAVTIPLREIRVPSSSVRRVREITEGDAKQALEPIYTAFARQYQGMFTTETHQWEQALKHHDSRTTFVYQHQSSSDDNGSDGYLLWRYNKEKNGSIGELVAHSPVAWEGFLSLLHHFATQCETATVTLPADTPLQSHLMHWAMETKVEPVFMGRVVNASAALESLSPAADAPNGALLVALQDEHAPWNTGLWRIAVEEGIIQCAAQIGGASREADVTLDINALSQAFWGTPSLAALRKAGRIRVASEAGFELLRRLLPAKEVYCMDDF